MWCIPQIDAEYVARMEDVVQVKNFRHQTFLIAIIQLRGEA
jgi:hypothetical protein